MCSYYLELKVGGGESRDNICAYVGLLRGVEALLFFSAFCIKKINKNYNE